MRPPVQVIKRQELGEVVYAPAPITQPVRALIHHNLMAKA